MTFSSLGLTPPLQQAVEALGYDTPTPIQVKAIPEILAGRDLMAAAQTGTGKTAGFTLPLLQRLMDGKPARHGKVRALVLTPTRELASQVAQSVADYSRYLDLRSTVVFGGVKIGPQITKLRAGVDVLTATPGRLLDLYQQKIIDFGDLEVLVLDEADRMLDMGFIRDIRKILAVLPEQRQNLLFSATFSSEIRKLAQGILHQPVSVEVAARNVTADTVVQRVHPVSKRGKTALLCHLFQSLDWQQVLVFTRTKHGANRLAQKLDRAGVSAAVIHGNKSQNARTRALADFKAAKVRALVATDIAARGLDIAELPHVVNFELPNVSEDYVHRIGRTGRAGSAGEAVSLVCDDEQKLLRGIERLTGQRIEQQVVAGFEPGQEAPEERSSSPRSRRVSGAQDEERPRRRRRGGRKTDAQGEQNGEQSRQRRRSTSADTAQTTETREAQPKRRRRRRSGKSRHESEQGNQQVSGNRQTSGNQQESGNRKNDSRKEPRMSEAAMHQAKADRELEERRTREERRLKGLLQPQRSGNNQRRGGRQGQKQGTGQHPAQGRPQEAGNQRRGASRRRRKPKQQDWSEGIGPLV